VRETCDCACNVHFRCPLACATLGSMVAAEAPSSLVNSREATETLVARSHLSQEWRTIQRKAAIGLDKRSHPNLRRRHRRGQQQGGRREGMGRDSRGAGRTEDRRRTTPLNEYIRARLLPPAAWDGLPAPSTAPATTPGVLSGLGEFIRAARQEGHGG